MNIDLVRSKKIILNVYGLGYIGLLTAVKLAHAGFDVVGIDTDHQKVEKLQKGILVDSEKYMHRYFTTAQNIQKLRIQTELEESRTGPKISMVCVPTPISRQSVTSDKYVKQAVESILQKASRGDMIILESSIRAGTTDIVRHMVESKGFKVGQDFGLAFCPERFDPKYARWNLDAMPRIIYCSDDNTFEVCSEMYAQIHNGSLKRVSNAIVAEVVKSFENAFRMVNISLVNEVAILADGLKIDIMEIIDAASTKSSGFMPFYPSAGAGGHCIPKDPLFLIESAKQLALNMPTLENALEINKEIPLYIKTQIVGLLEKNNLPKTVIVCGLAYKPNVEDMRDSPGFKILDSLNQSAVDAVGYDPYYQENLRKKYTIENNLEHSSDFKIVPDLSSISKYSCLCIVQHHTHLKADLEEIYRKGQVPLIYDCQSKLSHISESRTILRGFGS